MANYWQPSGLTLSHPPYFTFILLAFHSWLYPSPCSFPFATPSLWRSSLKNQGSKKCHGRAFLGFLLLICIGFHFLVFSHYITWWNACNKVHISIITHIVAPHKNGLVMLFKELPTSLSLSLQPMPLWVLGLIPPPMPCFYYESGPWPLSVEDMWSRCQHRWWGHIDLTTSAANCTDICIHSTFVVNRKWPL